MFTLRVEIIACLVAVSLLGLITGWMIQRTRIVRKLEDAAAQFDARYAALEQSASDDAQNLEDRLQQLGDEVKTLRAENLSLQKASRHIDDSVESVRAESIEMNQRNADVRERLQRSLRDRENEIDTLRAALAEQGGTSAARARPHLLPATSQEDMDVLDETVRIDPAQLPQGSPDHQAPHTGKRTASAEHDELFDETLNTAYVDAEEATIALDADALAMVHGLQAGRRR